jgi:tellurite resistance protein TehA-like permease
MEADIEVKFIKGFEAVTMKYTIFLEVVPCAVVAAYLLS